MRRSFKHPITDLVLPFRYYHNAFQDLGAVRRIHRPNVVDAGFKAIARRLCVGHAHSTPFRWNCEVEVFGVKVQPGQLIHADKHGFIVIPEEDEAQLLDAARFMDSNECNTVIAAARSSSGKPVDQVLADMEAASKAFGQATREKFGQKGEF